MITQYLNINVIELFNADRITWSHRSFAAFQLPSNTVDSIILKRETLQDSSQSRPNWVIWSFSVPACRWVLLSLNSPRITRFHQMLHIRLCLKTNPDPLLGSSSLHSFGWRLWIQSKHPHHYTYIDGKKKKN